MPNPRLVLASLSPRRSEILSRFGLRFDVEPADVDEDVLPDERPVDYVTRVAMEKATAAHRPDTVVVAADTSVVLNDQILGKPTDPEDAAEMLSRLSGNRHEVITGVVVVLTDRDGEQRFATGTESTKVQFSVLTPRRIAWYAALPEPLDKAGAYGLQGAGSLLADRIEGSVTNVVGLPVQLLDRLFDELGLDLLSFSAGGAHDPPS